MIMLRQLLYDLRTRPVIGIVTVIGTALAILLVMMVTIVYEIDYVPIAPESNRDLLLYDVGMYLRNEEGSACSSLSRQAIDRLYRPLKTASHVAAVQRFYEPVDVQARGGSPIIVDCRKADSEMWQIFDHTFIAGAPFTEADIDAGRDVAVIDESTSRRLYGTADAVGREIIIRGIPFTVVGVIRDTSPLMKWSYAQVWLPPTPEKMMVDSQHSELYGSYGAVIMARSREEVKAMREEARSINEDLNRELLTTGFERIDCDAPYSQLALSQVHGSNNPPDMQQYYVLRYLMVGIFLIIPAINLSSMTRSRLRRRRHEIGVRRAFGATRMEILYDILRENFVLTLFGGILGLILALVAVTLLADMLFEADSWDGASAPLAVTWRMLFHWSTFGWALLFCFLLNLLSAGIPAWHASRINPVEAINQTDD